MTTSYKLLAFVGPIGSGKTTAANIAANMGYAKLSFATPLKQMLQTLGLGASQVYGEEKEVPAALLGGRTPRHAMQTLGTEWGRDLIHPDLWVNAWAQQAIKLIPLQGVVVDDARFPNEYAQINKMRGLVVRIKRPDLISHTAHASEAHEAAAHLTIQNDGALDQLAEQVRAVVAKLGQGPGARSPNVYKMQGA